MQESHILKIPNLVFAMTYHTVITLRHTAIILYFIMHNVSIVPHTIILIQFESR
jgi:hypothetical protein